MFKNRAVQLVVARSLTKTVPGLQRKQKAIGNPYKYDGIRNGDRVGSCSTEGQGLRRAEPRLRRRCSQGQRQRCGSAGFSIVGQVILSLRGASRPEISPNPHFFASSSYASKDREQRTRLCRRATVPNLVGSWENVVVRSKNRRAGPGCRVSNASCSRPAWGPGQRSQPRGPYLYSRKDLPTVRMLTLAWHP